MNERIKELEKQSVFYNEDEEIWETDLEKFAELIVRNCLRQIYSKTLMATPEHRWTPEQTAYNEGIFAAYGQVKKHFGVE